MFSKTVGTEAECSELRKSVFNHILIIFILKILVILKLLVIFFKFHSKLGRGVISSFLEWS